MVIVIPAAGASSRMRGRDKLLETVDEQPLLARCTRRALATGWPVVVALSDLHVKRWTAIEGMAVTRVKVQDSNQGMAASIRDAMAVIPASTDAVMIVPADMPDLETVDFQSLSEAFIQDPTHIWRGLSDAGTPGHPVVFPKRLFPKLRTLDNGEGARAALEGEVVKLCPLPGQHALTDLDTPEDWAKWRAV
ncbi:MAG: nucleotidyltransferase family protein [Roseovarius sp.]|nr:nucleotidyltransferase family protein [Roseovarius sp.]